MMLARLWLGLESGVFLAGNRRSGEAAMSARRRIKATRKSNGRNRRRSQWRSLNRVPILSRILFIGRYEILGRKCHVTHQGTTMWPLHSLVRGDLVLLQGWLDSRFAGMTSPQKCDQGN